MAQGSGTYQECSADLCEGGKTDELIHSVWLSERYPVVHRRVKVVTAPAL
jgi:hypothetical protein